MRRILISVVTSVLSMGSAACQQAFPGWPAAAIPIVDNTSFHSCVDREAKAAFERAIKNEPDLALYGYHTDINNEVIAACSRQLSRETLNDSIYTTDPAYSYVNAAVEAQQRAARSEIVKKDMEEEQRKAALDTPRLKAEKAEEDEAGNTYYACLVRHAKILSLSSNEPAEVIVQASFPSCLAERQAAFDVLKRHKPYLDLETMDAMDGVFKQSLLLEIIKARAQPAAPPGPPPMKHETPI
jgi:hypothetical protein